MSFLTPKEKVSLWFHQPFDDNIAPCISIMQLNNIFLNWVAKHKLQVYNQQSFRKTMCNALCTLKESYDKTNIVDLKMIQFPNRKFQNPDWKDEFNELWDSYIQKIYTTDIVNYLIDSIDKAEWEITLPDWKIVICSILPYYIKPSVDILEDEGFLIIDEKEEYITFEEAQEEKEDDYY